MARYRPELSDQNKTLSCTVKQEENGRTHFTRTFVLRLEIERRVAVRRGEMILAEKISFALGVIVGMIFIILLCVLISVFTVKQKKQRREKREEREEREEGEDLDLMLDTEQSPLVIKRETLSRDCENGETPRWASQKYNESSFSSPPSNIEKFLSSYASPSNKILYNHLPSDIVMNGKTVEAKLTDQYKNFTSPSIRSLSASQLSSLQSFTDLTVDTHTDSCHHKTNSEQSKNIESAKNVTNHNHGYKKDPLQDSSFSPQRRFSGIALTFPSEPLPAPPRPPRPSKSLGHIPKSLESETQRKRRRTAPSASKSSHSLFECSEGCFDIDKKKSQPQLVTITTGPMVI